jgi:hypothetical protein
MQASKDSSADSNRQLNDWKPLEPATAPVGLHSHNNETPWSELASKHAQSAAAASTLLMQHKAMKPITNRTPKVQHRSAHQNLQCNRFVTPSIRRLFTTFLLTRRLPCCNQANQRFQQLLCCGPVTSSISPALRQSRSSAADSTISTAEQGWN